LKAGFPGTDENRIQDKTGYTLATHSGDSVTLHNPYGDMMVLSPAEIPDPKDWIWRDDERLVTVELYGADPHGESAYGKMDLTEEMIPHLIRVLQNALLGVEKEKEV
jgi:hypothetical protein